MSSDSSLFSYNKNLLWKGIVYGIIIFIVFFIASYGSFKMFSMNWIYKKSQDYIKLLEDHKDKSLQDNIYTFLEFIPNETLKLDADLKKDIETQKIKTFYINKKLYRYKDSIAFALRAIKHMNIGTLSNFFQKDDKYDHKVKDIFSHIQKCLELKIPAKIYVVLLAVGTLLTLLRLTVNFTFTTIISNTINSDNDVTPFGQTTFKPETSFVSKFFSMLGLFILNIFIGISPIIFIYGFNFIPTLYMNFPKTYKSFLGILLCVGTVVLFIIVLLYFYYSLFSQGLNLSSDPDVNSMTSNESSSKSILQSFFNTQDYDFADKIFSFKNTLAGSFGIWLFVFIMLFIFEIALMFNKKKYIGTKSQIVKLITIVLVLFAYSLFLSYRNYGSSDSENNVFNPDNSLTNSMYKDSVNNIFQALVKYNFPCMPFEN